MRTNRVVILIVEGPSDDDSVGILITGLFKKYYNMKVHVKIVHSDITSDFNVTSQTIAAKIGNIVKKCVKDNRFTKADIEKVYQIVDMDGAFVPDDAVVENENCDTVEYTLDNIITHNKYSIELRNDRKQKNLNKIFSMHSVWGTIPYKAFYMSCNLDHALYNELNSTDNEKEKNAHKFAKKYKENLDGFLELISDEQLLVSRNYNETCEFIKKDKNSLHRHTNLALMFDEIIEEKNLN